MRSESFAFTVDLPDELAFTPVQRRQLEDMMANLVVHGVLRREELTRESQQRLVEAMAGAIEPRRLDPRRARLQATALERVLRGTEWLTAEEVGLQGGHGSANPSAAANRWKSNGQLFAIRREGRDYFPLYALDESYRPRPVIAAVIKVLEPFSPLRLAAWFESPSSFLDGKRPRAVVAQDPARVVAAAQDARAQEHADA